MAWFSILFFFVWCVFILKNILTWFFGDLDMDIDFDGESDIDVSGMLSFKGVLHFLLGFSSILECLAFRKTESLTLPYSFSVVEYVFAVIFGCLSMIALYFLYRSMLTLNHYETNNVNVNDMVGKIYLINGNGWYEVLIDTPVGTLKKTVYSDKKEYGIGDEVRVKWDNKNKRYVTL